MIKTPRFENRIVEHPNNFIMENWIIEPGVYPKAFIPYPGTVLNEGTKLNSSYLNLIRDDLITLSDELDKNNYFIQGVLDDSLINATGGLKLTSYGFNIPTCPVVPAQGTSSRRNTWSKLVIYPPQGVNRIIIRLKVSYYHRDLSNMEHIQRVAGVPFVHRELTSQHIHFDICTEVDTSNISVFEIINEYNFISTEFKLNIEVKE